MTARLEELTKGALVKGVLGDRPVRVVDVTWHGSTAVTLTYTDELTGRADQDLLYRDDEKRLIVEEQDRSWAMNGDGQLFRLASEAKRISLAHLFDPFLAVQTSNLDPLPHQIDAVYNKMLPREPLRFLLADDPGAGKTIMAGLLCKELMIRGDVERCLVIAPGSLVEQWQDELWQKFALPFEILTRDSIEASRSGNPFQDKHLLIARLDHLSRNEDLQAKLQETDWDLVVVDEAHKMSAHYNGGTVTETRRYKLGKIAGSVTRHLLLMTATPHAGIQENFQLFLALLDADRFEGRAPNSQRVPDLADYMRRMVKEKLLTFDGRPLFPERRAYTVTYPLSSEEALLYKRVTEYVQLEMNRADRLKAKGEGSRGAAVGFALTILQRRLASSPEAIYQSLRRRRMRLEKRIAEERQPNVPADLDDLTAGELEDLEEQLVDQASAATTIVELEAEIRTLTDLEELARPLRDSRADRKWEELSSLLRNEPEMTGPNGARRKLIIFSEHRDTLNYLAARIRTLLRKPDAVVTLHGGMHRDERRKIQDAFTQDPNVLVLVATDAAGEGVNLQRAHLMVNYDLPWNPNRIEQRFGRVHRIGQTEVCHLWNLVAEDTREGQVFQRLFDKLDVQRRELGGQVFDVLGEAFHDRSLRDLLIEAVRYGERLEVRERLDAVVDATVGAELTRVVRDRVLITDLMTRSDVERIREDIERAEARTLQPHFTQPFFLEAFGLLGGSIREREPGRFEITNVPAELRRNDATIPLLRRYERVTFDRSLVTSPGRPPAEFLAPGHPLLDGTIDLVLERFDGLLRQGAVLVDESDPGEVPGTLVYLQHAIVDGRLDRSGNRRTVSKRFDFVCLRGDGERRHAGWAPYLDLRPAASDELQRARRVVVDVEKSVIGYGVELAREHLGEVRRRTLERVDRTAQAIDTRLTPQIRHWEHRATELREQERAGKQPRSGMNSARARQRSEELAARLRHRLEELDAERRLSSLPPVVAGAAMVLPVGLLAAGEADQSAARRIVLDTERRLGRSPRSLPGPQQGYEIESVGADGSLIFIAVKSSDSGTFRVTRTEIGVAKNVPGRYVLAMVDANSGHVRYLRGAFEGMNVPEFGIASVSLPWQSFLERGQIPR